MKSKISLLVGIPAALSLALASLIPAAHAALPPGTPLFNVQADAGYYQLATPSTPTPGHPSEDLAVAVKSRANNGITNATVTFAVGSVPSGVTVNLGGNPTYTVSGTTTPVNGLYVLPANQVNLIGAPTATGTVTIVATTTVSGAGPLGGVGTIGTPQTFTIVLDPLTPSGTVTNAVLSYVTPAGFSATPPATQTAPYRTVYPFQDEVQVTSSVGIAGQRPVPGVRIVFTIANTGATAGGTFGPNANFVGDGQTATVITDAEGIATAPRIITDVSGSTFSVTATYDSGQGVIPSGTNTLVFNYAVTGIAAEVCQLFIGAFTAGGTDSLSLRTGDQGPASSLSSSFPNGAASGPVLSSSTFFGGLTGQSALLQKYALFSYLTLGTAGGPGIVRAIPLVPRYYTFVGGGASPNTTGLSCSITFGNTPATFNLVTVTATLQALVVTSSRAGVQPGDTLTVTASKTTTLNALFSSLFGITSRGLNPVTSEQITVQDTSGASPTTVFGGGSLSVAPQSFILGFDGAVL